MSPAYLLDSLGTIGDAPEGIERLRQLVLQLAVRGRLVTQDSQDGNAEVLLSSLPALCKQMIEKKIIIKPRSTSPTISKPDPYEIPTQWCWAYLGDVCAIVGGGTPKSGTPAYWADKQEIPWLTPADMRHQSSRLINRGARDITQEGLDKSSARILPAGAVLFSSRAPIGHVGISAQPLSTNQGFKSCVPYQSEMSEYIYWYLKKIGPEVNETASGTTFKEVSGSDVAAFQIPIPPLAEQHRIVAKVDELMALLDELEQARDERDAHRAAFRDSALSALQNAEDSEAVEAAWSRIATNLADCITGPADIAPLRQTILQLAVRGRLLPNTDGCWSKCTLGEQIMLQRGFDMTKAQQRPGDVPVVSSGGVKSYHDESRATGPGVVLGRKGSVGRVHWIEEDYWPHDTTLWVKDFRGNLPRYVYLFLLSFPLKEYESSTANPSLNRNRLHPVSILWPSVEAQPAVIAKVDELMAICDELEQRLAEAKTHQSAFAAAAVHHLDLAQETQAV